MKRKCERCESQPRSIIKCQLRHWKTKKKYMDGKRAQKLSERKKNLENK